MLWVCVMALLGPRLLGSFPEYDVFLLVNLNDYNSQYWSLTKKDDMGCPRSAGVKGRPRR
jgi:hypothetical protein